LDAQRAEIMRRTHDPGKLSVMEPAELHRRTVAEFAARVDAIGDGSRSWSAVTPCAEWDVRTLVNHLTAENRWTAPLLGGATVADIGDKFDGDLVGDDPVGAFAAASSEATEASARVDPEAIVHLSFGDFPAREYLYQLSADHLVHAWDLAAATGGDRNFDEELVAEIADWYAERESAYRDTGAVGPRVQGAGDDPQDRLLAAFGRDSGWRPVD
jgi:uncharacterized protein (TIGR03086 family)